MIRLSILLLLVVSPATLVAQALTLEQCVKRALGQNVDVRVAEQNLQRSADDVKSARANKLPAADATLFGYGRSRTGPSVRFQEIPSGEIDAGNVITTVNHDLKNNSITNLEEKIQQIRDDITPLFSKVVLKTIEILENK